MEVKYQVFVSSTYKDLKEERQEVIKVILQMGHIPVSMEFFSAANEDQWTLIRALLDECDYYIVVVGGIYGSIDKKTGKSYTQLEYEYAVEKGIPVIGFLHRDIESLPPQKCESDKERKNKLNTFSELVRERTCDFWTTAHELSAMTAVSLINLIRRHPRQGWVKASPAQHDDGVNAISNMRNVAAEEKINQSLSSSNLDEGSIREAFKSAMSGFANFIELYYVIEGLYSHSNRIERLPNSYLIPIRENNIPPHLQQINELWRRSYASIHRFIRIKGLCKDRKEFRVLDLASSIYISYIYHGLTELWGDVPYVDTPMEISESMNITRTGMNQIKEISVDSLLHVLNDHAITPQYFDLAIGMLLKWELRSKNYKEAKAYTEKLIGTNRYQLAKMNEIFSTERESMGSFDTDKEPDAFKSIDFRELGKKGRYVHYMRYTEILLMASEIYYHLSNKENALHFLNMIKHRNGQTALSGIDTDFIPSMLAEWKNDLGMEGSYFSALKRNGFAGKLIGIPEYKMVLPIPMQELAVNPRIAQNAGY